MWAVILGVPVTTMPRIPSLRSLFLAWVCFSLAFSTVFRAFLTKFLIDSGYKTPIQNVDEMFASGIKLAFPEEYNGILEIGDEKEKSEVGKNRVNCPSGLVCEIWAMNQRNISILFNDVMAAQCYANGSFLGENSEPLMCRLEDGVVYTKGFGMLMLYGDPLMGPVNKIIDRLVQAGIYNHWISYFVNMIKCRHSKIAIVHPLDGYHSFNLYHLQPAFYLLLIGWCLSVLCFALELMFNGIFHKEVELDNGSIAK
jgi:hypothetical protein